MPKIHTFTGKKIFEKEIRTIAWFKSVLKKSSTTNPTQFGNLIRDLKGEFGEGKRQWHNYGKKLSCPYDDTIEDVEKLFPGTGDIFKNGPEESFLFRAMFEDEEHYFAEAMRRKTIPFKGLSANSYRLGLLDTEDIKNILSFLELILNEYRKTNSGYLGYSPQALLCLSNSTILFRYLIKRSSYSFSDYYVEDSLAIIINIIETEDMKTFLNEYEIRNLFLSWLYIKTIDWCSHSHTGNKFIISTCHSLPSSEAFIKNPKLFLKELLKAQLEYAIRYDYDGGDKTIIEVNQFVAKKVSKWFPDEEIDFIDQLSYLKDSLSSDAYSALTSA